MFGEINVNGTDTSELKIKSLTDGYDMFHHGESCVKYESKVPSRI